MDTILLISLLVPPVIAFFTVFFEHKSWKRRIILWGLALVALLASYMITKKDNKENEEMKYALQETIDLLHEAKATSSDQSKMIKEGFDKLIPQIASAGINNTTILESVKQLNIQVDSFTSNTKNYFNQANENLSQKKNDDVSDNEVVISNDYWRIPIEWRNTIEIDQKNVLTIRGYKLAESIVMVKLNGRDLEFSRGGEWGFVNHQNKSLVIVYKGIEKGKFVFYIHE